METNLPGVFLQFPASSSCSSSSRHGVSGELATGPVPSCRAVRRRRAPRGRPAPPTLSFHLLPRSPFFSPRASPSRHGLRARRHRLRSPRANRRIPEAPPRRLLPLRRRNRAGEPAIAVAARSSSTTAGASTSDSGRSVHLRPC